MTDAIHGLVSDAKKSKFSTIGHALTDEDVVSVWDNVSEFVEKQMSQQKGVNIPGLGTFSFSQKKLDIGNNKHLLIQRPIFMLSEKFAQTHGLHFTKYHSPGNIPIVQLNFAALASESPFSRDLVEGCVKEVLMALNRSVNSKRNVEFSFTGIGRLQIRNGKAKVKFYKEFLNSMDGSGRLVDALKNRPGTVDSVMSEAFSRPHTSNTLILPRSKSRISHTSLHSNREGQNNDKKAEMPTIDELEDDLAADVELDVKFETEQNGDEVLEGAVGGAEEEVAADEEFRDASRTASGNRIAAPMAQAGAFSFGDDLLLPPSKNPLIKSSPAPLSASNYPGGLKPPSPPQELLNQRVNILTPPKSACGHNNSGQELCYLCHQRERRNIPVSFAEERARNEQEEDHLLQQYQHLKDTETVLKEQAEHGARRHENQKIAAFNLGVSDAVKVKRNARPTDFYKSYIFQRRPVTPPRYIKQEDLHKSLAHQVDKKRELTERIRSDEKFLERLEQVQLAEDLAAQREQYLKDRLYQKDMYKRALSAQLKFQPAQLPKLEPDSSEPIFGKDDVTLEKLTEKRRKAYELYKEQLDTVAGRKRDAILKKIHDQKEEEHVLKRTKEDMIDDRANKYDKLFKSRRRLEDDWSKAADAKRQREYEERLRAKSPGILVHEQCDKYHRCRQCLRQLSNCGESNIWCDSRYIPGSRLIV